MRKLKVEDVLEYFQETEMKEVEPMLRLVTKAVAARRPLKAINAAPKKRMARKAKLSPSLAFPSEVAGSKSAD